MRQWLRSIDWVAINTCALGLVVALWALSSLTIHGIQNQPHGNNANTEPQWNGPWWLAPAIWEAIFTGGIALYAVRQYGESRRSSERQLRAYVYVSFEHKPVQVAHSGQIVSYRFTPIWHNSGATPTRNMTNHISLGLFSGDMPAGWHFPDRWKKSIPPSEWQNVQTLAGPNSDALGQALDVDMATMVSVVTGSGPNTLYIWGWAKYDDVFSHTPRRVTRFCNKILVGGDPTQPDKCTITFPLHSEYNCADEECDA